MLHEDGVKLLNLMFDPGETVCVSPNKWAYHSVPLEEALSDKVSLRSPVEDIGTIVVPTNELMTVAMNPINGWRQDQFATNYRNFMVELDFGTQTEQLGTIKHAKMPYSSIVFSGNKSLHFTICLSKNILTAERYSHIAKWILNIISSADQNTSNPSRSTRIPGGLHNKSGKVQELLELRGRIDPKDLFEWLRTKRAYEPKAEEPDTGYDNIFFNPSGLPRWVIDFVEGDKDLDMSEGRNKAWFSVSCAFCLAGFSEDATIEKLSSRFVPERDFSKKEWKTTVKSAFKYMRDKR